MQRKYSIFQFYLSCFFFQLVKTTYTKKQQKKWRQKRTKQHSVFFFGNANYKYRMIIYTLNDLLFSFEKKSSESFLNMYIYQIVFSILHHHLVFYIQQLLDHIVLFLFELFLHIDVFYHHLLNAIVLQ